MCPNTVTEHCTWLLLISFFYLLCSPYGSILCKHLHIMLMILKEHVHICICCLWSQHHVLYMHTTGMYNGGQFVRLDVAISSSSGPPTWMGQLRLRGRRSVDL